ncbi:hypothetical protein PQO03_19425 [Lentisphaera profundi]|uniref:Uncharacterized protein n=1 Tax=Lentisphaera profundi TaxID=1658616 RepID=A0ABY7VUV0_9BACT|nr:hypothetical protein [Lentisphaera profundi]WDE98001.1 hypothetical protein PQO03_19425 [Lentisphaera profundi]
MKLSFIADGKLFFKRTDNVEEIKSQFVEDLILKLEKSEKLSAWKQESTNPMSPSVWGGQARASQQIYPRFIDVCKGEEGFIFYLINYSEVTALFKYELETKVETRLFHKNNFPLRSIDYSSENKEFIGSFVEEDGSSNLIVLNEDGRMLNSITAGDSLDLNPSFCRKNPDLIFYSSAGIARDEMGNYLAHDIFSLHSIDKKTMQADDIYRGETNSLVPKTNKSGELFFISSPYKGAPKVTIIQQLKNIVLFPFYFVGAIYNFLKVFTQIFNHDRVEAGAAQQTKKEKEINLLGEWVNCSKLKKNKQGEINLVPESWVLCSHDGATILELKKHINAFDINTDSFVYTNGFKLIDKLSDKLIHKEKLVEKVCLL